MASNLVQKIGAGIPGGEGICIREDENTSAAINIDDLPTFTAIKERAVSRILPFLTNDQKHHIHDVGDGGQWTNSSSPEMFCSFPVLSLFLDLGMLKKEKEGREGEECLPVSCQPDVNAKRFTEVYDIKTLSLSRVPVTAVLFSRTQNDSAGQSQVQPMHVSTPAQASLGENHVAQSVSKEHISSAFKILFGNSIDDIIQSFSDHEEVKEKGKQKLLCPALYFFVLLTAIEYAFPLHESRGWLLLLKQLLKSEVDSTTSSSSLFEDVQKDCNLTCMRLVKQLTLVSFASLIKVKAAFLTGEATMYGVKHALLHEDEILSEFPSFCSLQMFTPLEFSTENSTLPCKALKKHSHDLLVATSEMLQTSSLLDFVMENAMNNATNEVDDDNDSVLLADLAGPVTLEEYEEQLHQAQKNAMDLLAEISTCNKHVESIIANYDANSSGIFSTQTMLPLIKKRLFCPLSSKNMPYEIFWIVGLLTQWSEPESANALFSLLRSTAAKTTAPRNQLKLLPSGRDSAQPGFGTFINRWNCIYKSRIAFATTLFEKLLSANSSFFRRKIKKTKDEIGRMLSPFLLKAIEAHGVKVEFPTTCPTLVKHLGTGNEGNIDRLLELLLGMAADNNCEDLKFGPTVDTWAKSKKPETGLNEDQIFELPGKQLCGLSKLLENLLAGPDASLLVQKVEAFLSSGEEQKEKSKNEKKKSNLKQKDPQQKAGEPQRKSDDGSNSSGDEEQSRQEERRPKENMHIQYESTVKGGNDEESEEEDKEPPPMKTPPTAPITWSKLVQELRIPLVKVYGRDFHAASWVKQRVEVAKYKYPDEAPPLETVSYCVMLALARLCGGLKKRVNELAKENVCLKQGNGSLNKRKQAAIGSSENKKKKRNNKQSGDENEKESRDTPVASTSKGRKRKNKTILSNQKKIKVLGDNTNRQAGGSREKLKESSVTKRKKVPHSSDSSDSD